MDFFSPEFLFIVYLINLISIAYIKYSNPGYIKNVILFSAGLNFGNVSQKNKTGNQSFTNILLSVNFYISASIFLIFVLRKSSFDFNNYNYFLVQGIIIGIFLFIFYANTLINYFSAYVFKLKNTASQFSFVNQNTLRSLGIILFIINILVSYSPVKNFAVYTGIVFIFLFYLLRILKFIKINLSEHINSLYLFLYLCSVEIFPLIYIIKFIMIKTGNN